MMKQLVKRKTQVSELKGGQLEQVIKIQKNLTRKRNSYSFPKIIW